MVFHGPWHFKTRLYLVNFQALNACTRIHQKEGVYFVAFAVECFMVAGFQQCKRRISVCNFGRPFWEFGTWDLSVPCIYDRLSCFFYPIQSNLLGCGFFTQQRAAAWNPSKFTCLFEVSKYGVGLAGSTKNYGWVGDVGDDLTLGTLEILKINPPVKSNCNSGLCSPLKFFYLNFSLFGVVKQSVLLGVSHFVTSLYMRYLEEKTPRVFLLENVSKTGLLLLLKRWLAN